jgi:hypothetical protein
MSVVARASACGAVATLIAAAMIAGSPAANAGGVDATTITVTGVPAGYTIINTATSTAVVTASGTATGGGSGDTVDVRCYTDDTNAFKTFATSVPVSNSGAWSATGPLTSISGFRCRLVAVPHGWSIALNDPGSATFQRSAPVLTGSVHSSSRTSGPNTGTTYDYDLASISSQVSNEVDSVAGCGPESAMSTPALQDGDYLWVCMVDLFATDDGDEGGPTASASVKIGGHDAFTPDSINDTLALTHGAISYRFSQNRANGNLVVNETDPYYYCRTLTNGFVDGSNGNDCPALQYSGVTLHRTYTTANGGQAVVVSDTFQSTDHAKHPLALEYTNDVDEDGPIPPSFKLPGASAFSVPASGTTGNVTTWPKIGSFDVREDSTPAVSPSVTHPAGAVTWSSRPTSAYFSIPEEFFLNYTRTIPASGSFTLTHSLAMSSTQTEVNKLAAAQVKADRPTLSFHAPSRSHQHSLVLRGRVVNGGNGAITSVTVKVGSTKAHKVKVSAQGAFRFRARLKKGRNHIEVSGKDPVGNVAKSAHTVRRR